MHRHLTLHATQRMAADCTCPTAGTNADVICRSVWTSPPPSCLTGYEQVAAICMTISQHDCQVESLATATVPNHLLTAFHHMLTFWM